MSGLRGNKARRTWLAGSLLLARSQQQRSQQGNLFLVFRVSPGGQVKGREERKKEEKENVPREPFFCFVVLLFFKCPFLTFSCREHFEDLFLGEASLVGITFCIRKAKNEFAFGGITNS